MLEPIQISLSYKDDQQSRGIREGRFWNLYLKINHKIESLFSRLRDQRLKRHLISSRKKSKYSTHASISPFSTTEYAWTYWRKQGSKNFYQITKRLRIKQKKNRLSQEPEVKHNELLQELCLACNHALNNSPNDRDTVFLYDNYNFSNSAHLALIEETLDIFSAFFKNVKCYFFLDSANILLPTAAKLITSKYEFCEVIDASDFTICFPENAGNRNLLLSSSEIQNSINFKISRNSEFNPIMCWSSQESQARYSPQQKAWEAAYSKEQSREIILSELKQKGIILKSKQYIAVHSRNSHFLSANIRDSLPLYKRNQFFEEIRSANLSVIIFGIQKPEDKYMANNIIYLCDIGIFDDSFQMHVLNGALAMVGSPSGITHMTYCTNTPTLLIDVHTPAIPALPNSTCLAVLKPLERQGIRLGLSEYYNIRMDAYLIENEGMNTPRSPLNYFSIELKCNSDRKLIAAFYELILKQYSLAHLEEMDIFIANSGYATENDLTKAALKDIEEIQDKTLDFNKTGQFPAFKPDVLAKANWIDF